MELGDWWTAFYEGDPNEREQLVATANAAPSGAKRKRAPRRAPRKTGAAASNESTTSEE
jgi:poly(A) polymerase